MTGTALERAEHAVDQVAACYRLNLAGFVRKELAVALVASQHLVHGHTVRLTDRRLEVLRLCAQGMTAREMADRMGVSMETAKSHIQAMLRSTGARDRAQAVAIGFAAGLLTAADLEPVGERAA